MEIKTVILIALGGAFAVEGVGWAVAPRMMRESYSEFFAMGDTVLHRVGLFSVASGTALIVWAFKSAGG